jgi:hypothetical protein
MKSVISALLLVVSSTTASAAPSVLEALQPRAGLYALSANDEANPCRGGSDFELGKEARLVVLEAPEATEFQPKGDLTVRLEQYGDRINKWYPLFDRFPFFRINKGSERSMIPSEGLWITHKSTYSHAKGVLQHSFSVNSITGSQAGIQTIEFNDAEKKFTYTYDIVDYNAIGLVTKTHPAGRCEFTKKD